MDIRLLAKRIISCSDEVTELMDGLQGNGIVSKFGADHAGCCRLYRKHRKIQAALLENFFDFGKNGKITEEDRAAIEEVQQRYKGLTNEQLSQEFGLLANQFFESPLEDETFDLSEVIFFVKVWFPCWLVYAEYPPKLIRKARQGDYKSLEKLLRLDVNVLQDKKISRIWAEIGQNRRSIHYRNLIKSLQKGLAGKQTARKKSKDRIAAFVCELAKSLGQPMTYDEIYSLFDEVSQERFKQQDSDIQDDPAAFKKVIQRILEETPYLSDRDKNKI